MVPQPGTLVGEKGSAIYENKERIARIGIDTCSKDDVVVYQGATAPLPTGIPTYTVQILNMCMSGCVMSHIHLSCGWFSSARLINPSVFRRLRYGDCLVNDGGPLSPGQSLSFQYANTYQYQLEVSSVVCN
ncbi:TPD1 protein [Carex littledalei]|uniref:TPD1 protein n=1 Tax=Carex littledalei TaxID=544730 RepID=A0A833QGI6_9POAL|nr:TPD1 protein [Carex littledalei]